MIPNPALLEIEALAAQPAEAENTLQMDQDQFCSLYERTARPLWVFLLRRTSDEHLADDLLQETYYRFLRTRREYNNEAHRRNYLFRIASNVANDALRQRRDRSFFALADEGGVAAATDVAGQSQKRTDLARAMQQLNARQQEALWLAYAEGSSHEEIAGVLGMKTNSVKLLLFRARRKLAALLRGSDGRTAR